MATKVKRRHVKEKPRKKDERNKLEKLKDSKKDKKTARLYRRKNSKRDKELNFRTPKDTKLT